MSHDHARPLGHWTSIPALVDHWAARTPDAPAVSFPGGGGTFAELSEASRRAAGRLAAAGFGRGDRIAIFVREVDVEYVALCLGALRLGAPIVPVNARNKVLELEEVLRHSEPALLLVAAEFEPLIARVEAARKSKVVIIQRDEPFHAVAGAAGPTAEATPSAERDDVSVILYTSGTTAAPKGCLHSHATLLAEGEMCAQRLGVGAADRLWSPLTFFHIGGWQGLMIAWARGACYSHVGFFTAQAALEQLERERCTIAFPAFEPMWLAILNHPRFAEADLSSLRVVINVAVPESLRAMQAALPTATQVSCIGMTEAGGSICMAAPEDSYELRTETSGRPLPGAQVRVVDPLSGAELPAGAPGELLFRSPAQFLGYFRDPDKTAQTILDGGWVRTGDMVQANDLGACTFMSRLKDMLKVGGENVAAAEIERYLLTHSAVSLVAVVGAPDARYGEVPAAFVELAPGAAVSEQDLIDYCLGRIATFKVPRYIRIVRTLPTTASGKLQKMPLQSQIAAELREKGVVEAPRLATR